jgi:lysophospholipase L1-like esterase
MKKEIFILLFMFGLLSMTSDNNKKPTLFIIGDSTVKNNNKDSFTGLFGWGDFIKFFLDTNKIDIQNHAIGGRSSRTFIDEGRWQKVLDSLKTGDYVLIQFGHNDGGPLNTGRARGTLKGTGEDTVEVIMESTGEKKIVHTYGWYIRKYIRDAKQKGAIPIVCSIVPRNIWNNDSVARASNDYGKWAKEVAVQEKAYFIDINEIIASYYEKAGKELVSLLFFLTDHTHTTAAGAKLNAYAVITGIKQIPECSLNKYILIDEKKTEN